MQNLHRKLLKVGSLNIEIYPTRAAAAEAAAQSAAQELRKLREQSSQGIGVIFATGASQLDMLHTLISILDLPWERITGFHMDEYEGISPDHRASFRGYLRKHLTQRVPMRDFFEIDGTSADPELICKQYAEALHTHNPQLCLMGIGENGHLAFNEPAVADFEDPRDMKIVELDATCKNQQVEEGWFHSVAEVPSRALTLTIPTLLRVPRLIVSVPGPRKAHIIKRTLVETISTKCPATILRNHPNATVYLDLESASELDDLLSSNEAERITP
ncbi:MAG TPA: 6-phosphogluconolactonase [Acidobacteriaceae bacterium]|nr:6-phosphogluconolactonase [Acidobacteriaceae bacterium]